MKPERDQGRDHPRIGSRIAAKIELGTPEPPRFPECHLLGCCTGGQCHNALPHVPILGNRHFEEGKAGRVTWQGVGTASVGCGVSKGHATVGNSAVDSCQCIELISSDRPDLLRCERTNWTTPGGNPWKCR